MARRRPSAPAPQRPSAPAPQRPSAPAPQRPSAPAPQRPSAPAPQRPSAPAAAGDIVVTKVADHYHIGRVQADGEPFAAIEIMNSRTDAIALACQLVTGRQRVFIYERSGSSDCAEIDCAKPY